jgi:hypothetical protein
VHTFRKDGERLPLSDPFKKRHLVRGIAAEERFIYEIMWLCLVLTLTCLDEVRKMRSIQGIKEKTASTLSRFDRHEELLTAQSRRLKA